MTQILVTGGAGYIGSITVNLLIKQGYEVIIVDSLENGHIEAIPKETKFYQLNISNKKALDKVFKENNIKAVIDFAAYLAVGESMKDPVKYLENNVLNFITLLDVMKENNCLKIIKSSTAAAYGNPDDKWFPLSEDYTEIFRPQKSFLLPGTINDQEFQGEDFFQQFLRLYNQKIKNLSYLQLTKDELTMLRISTSIYGLTKLLDEIIMKKYDDTFGIKSVALRYFNVAGAHPQCILGEDKPNPTNLMTVTIYKALGKFPKLQVFGNDYPTKDGTGVRDYIHVCDLAEGHIKALEYILKSHESNTFNLGTGKGYSVLEVISKVEVAASTNIDFDIVERRSGDPAISYSNPRKANEMLGWQAKYDIKDMAETAWKWHSSHPNGFKK